ncbi:hypothetical protein DMC01_13375, partial [Campylobacter troglodytis]
MSKEESLRALSFTHTAANVLSPLSLQSMKAGLNLNLNSSLNSGDNSQNGLNLNSAQGLNSNALSSNASLASGTAQALNSSLNSRTLNLNSQASLNSQNALNSSPAVNSNEQAPSNYEHLNPLYNEHSFDSAFSPTQASQPLLSLKERRLNMQGFKARSNVLTLSLNEKIALDNLNDNL